MAQPSEGRKWQRLIRAACETWHIQAQAGPVTERQLEAIINRAAVPILRSVQDHPPELMTALLPSRARLRGPGRQGPGVALPWRPHARLAQGEGPRYRDDKRGWEPKLSDRGLHQGAG